MKLRFPGLREIVSLFVADTSVDAALSSLQRAHGRLLRVMKIKQHEADTLGRAAPDHLKEADRLTNEQTAALGEVARSERVAHRLQELFA